MSDEPNIPEGSLFILHRDPRVEALEKENSELRAALAELQAKWDDLFWKPSPELTDE